jgi:FkbM family methyltransferase
LRRTFRNGEDLARALDNGHEPSVAVLQSGQTIRHPAGASGLLEAILEIWYSQIYTPRGFYIPTAGDVLIDAGANIGLFTLFALGHFPDCRVIAIEPFEENFACLRQNLADDSASEQRKSAHMMALGGKTGMGSMVRVGTRSLDHVLSAGAIGTGGSVGVADGVEVVCLEDVIATAGVERIAFLKLDVEGSEKQIFEGVSDAALRRIDRIAAEYHDNLVPGCLATLRARLEPTHQITVQPGQMKTCGMLYAAAKRPRKG